jgi:hypothetical protein
MKIAAGCFSEMPLNSYQFTRCHIPEDRNHHGRSNPSLTKNCMGYDSQEAGQWPCGLESPALDQTAFIQTHKVVARCYAASDHPEA